MDNSLGLPGDVSSVQAIYYILLDFSDIYEVNFKLIKNPFFYCQDALNLTYGKLFLVDWMFMDSDVL